jgi:hypothetical protein
MVVQTRATRQIREGAPCTMGVRDVRLSMLLILFWRRPAMIERANATREKAAIPAVGCVTASRDAGPMMAGRDGCG